MTEDTIVVGVDGSSASMAALQWAYRQASTLGASLHVVSAWYHDEMLDDLSTARPLAEAARAHRDELEKLVAGIAAGGVDVRCEVPVGDPTQLLVERSKEAVMLVLGSHGGGKLKHLLVGSVCDACLRHASCPVVVVPPTARAPESRLGRMLGTVSYTPGPVL